MGFKIRSTEKTTNLSLAVPLGVDMSQVERELDAAAGRLGLLRSHTTTLSQSKYPGNRHWHYKQVSGGKGCLDATFWPAKQAFWLSRRNYEPQWVHAAGESIHEELGKVLGARAQ